MTPFDLSYSLQQAYDAYPPVASHPVIGITGNYGDQTCKLADGYYKQVVAAGGTPVVLPPLADREALLAMLDRIDGLLLSGGADVNPLFCGDEPSPRLGGINSERDLGELLLTQLAFNRQLPILGICRGMQVLAMALGGKIHQDIAAVASIKHSQEADRSTPTHSVTLEEGSLLQRILSPLPSPSSSPSSLPTSPSPSPTPNCRVGGIFAATPPSSPLYVNSFHHQAVSDAGPRLRTVALAPDGIIEGVESSELKPVVGVQWHPECMGTGGLPLFCWLVGEARRYRAAQQLHDRILTLDTHCDTPMFFPQGIDFSRRDNRILVDLTKMTEGRLDATIMVAYLPQDNWHPSPASNNGGYVAATPQAALSPRQFADDIFDRIEAIVKAHPRQIAIARTPADLWANKRAGLKSIMLGIENGLALEGNLDNLNHFARRGIVYITLCHNGDNDICDSAKGTQTHGGVSAFGEQVIREMNRLGIMVDMSHAAESSFYDALDISQKPVVCSHSSARALCDHPRNLTDDQMRALANKGGVAQTTLYPGFLVKQGEASILDALAHLEHAIDVMGIDHVGLGTDFDGDGGVRGLANASELTLFTRQLLARRYSESDIQKIWGGNFLRVMQQQK